MPFIGQDWRAPGETWVRTQEGWERMKLRPLLPDNVEPLRERPRTCSESSGQDFFPGTSLWEEPIPLSRPGSEGSLEDVEEWLPHCFVKTGKSKEFVGCTSLSEAFHKLNLARAVADIQRHNYVCKVVEILVREKLQNLSGSARKALLSVVEAIVLKNLETFTQVNSAKFVVSEFVRGLSGGHHCGSPTLLLHHQDAVSNLFELLSATQPGTPAESNEDSVTFLDLPTECLRAVLRKLSDHQSLLEAAKAHEALSQLVETEQKIWKDLCSYHFSEAQIKLVSEKMSGKPNNSWRHLFFELKKHYVLVESYADMIHICCHCKALFWKKLGHPCISLDGAPSVRVTPVQFVDMLLFL